MEDAVSVRRAAERADEKLEGLLVLGPTYSRPVWIDACTEASEASRLLWTNWAEAFFPFEHGSQPVGFRAAMQRTWHRAVAVLYPHLRETQWLA